jgi:hypothetical protein
LQKSFEKGHCRLSSHSPFALLLLETHIMADPSVWSEACLRADQERRIKEDKFVSPSAFGSSFQVGSTQLNSFKNNVFALSFFLSFFFKTR